MKNLLLTSFLLIVFNLSLFGQNTNNALNFQNNNYLNINNIAPDVKQLDQFTIEFWVRYDKQQNTEYNVFYAANDSDYTNRFFIRSSYQNEGGIGKVVIYLKNTSGIYLIGNKVIGDTRCHHIAFTYDNQACSLYVDGILDATVNHFFEFEPSDLHSIGQEYDENPNQPSQFYNGELDDFRIWNYAKTQSEIANNKNTELAGNETGLLVYYDFNQGVANGNNTGLTSLENKAQPNTNGTLVDFSLDNNTSNFISGTCLRESLEVENYEILNQLNISPNPTSGIINIDNIDNISSIYIKNSLGQVILHPKVASIIDISSLSKAYYFIEVVDVNGFRKTIKIMKQ
jgi:hypothetical protein